MAEPEEESDEEWQKIAEVVNIVEQQVIFARAQTAAGHAGVRAQSVAQRELQVASPPPPQHQQRQIQASPPNLQLQQMQLQAPQHPSLPSPPPQPPQLQLLQQQIRPQLPGRPVLTSTPPAPAPAPPPPPHPARRHVQFPGQGLQVNQNASFGQVTSALPPHPSTNRPNTMGDAHSGAESATTIASLHAENARLHQEYRTRIRHLEARLQNTRTQGNLRSQLALAEREIRTLRGQRPRARVGATQATQAGEVVEATQTGLEVLKASIAADVEKGVEMFGCGGLDDRVQGGLLRRELFRIWGYERLPGVSVCTGCEDWGELTRVLVGLMDGEGWMCALKGLNVLLRVREARCRIIGMREVGHVVECVYGNEFGYGVLEKMVMGCAEIGQDGDGVRRLVMGDERLPKMFRNGKDVDGVVRMGVIGILECDDGRVDDSEWGVVEGIIEECCKQVDEGVRMDVLGIACVLAAEVVIRHGGVEGLLEFVCGRNITGNDEGLVKGLEILATLIDEGLAGVGKVRVKGAVKIMGIGGLIAMAKRNGLVGELACQIVDGMYTLEKRCHS